MNKQSTSTSRQITVSIQTVWKEGPWGGSNQFLKALRKQLEKMGIYRVGADNSDATIIDSFHFERHNSCFDFLQISPKRTLIIHRVDGPIAKYRGKDILLDKIIYFYNKYWADGTVFQSEWSRDANRQQGMGRNHHEIIIMNAADPDTFNPHNKVVFSRSRKTRLIAVSWSSHRNKGFSAYQYLDNHLDFDRFKMTFIGNSPVRFKHIRQLEPLSHKKLAEELKQHDIYITASQNDPCSNALIEAMSCGLPVVALDSGGHPEIVRSGGVLFKHKEEIIDKIEQLVDTYDLFQGQIDPPSLEKTAEKYHLFINEICTEVSENAYVPKKPSLLSFSLLWLLVTFWKTTRVLQKLQTYKHTKGQPTARSS